MNNGFTLIELLVSVAIIGILTSISIANYQSYREKAYVGAAISQGKNLRLAFEGGDAHSDAVGSGDYFAATYEIGTANPTVLRTFINSMHINYPITAQNITKYLPGFNHDRKVYVEGLFFLKGNLSTNQFVVRVCSCKVQAEYAGILKMFQNTGVNPNFQELPGFSCVQVPCP